MNKAVDHHLFQAKAILCMVLMLNIQFWLGGCGINGCGSNAAPFGLLPDGVFRIDLTPDHPLAIALRGTAFADATAVEVNSGAQTFRVIFPDPSREMSGRYVHAAGMPTITDFYVATGSISTAMELDTAKHVTRISTGKPGAAKHVARVATGGNQGSTTPPQAGTGTQGQDTSGGDQVWVAPAEWLQAPISTTGANAYERANAQLLAFAREMDGDSSAKTAQASFAPVLVVFGVLAAIWAIGAIVLVLTVIFAVLAALQAVVPPGLQKLDVTRVLDPDSLVGATFVANDGDVLAVLGAKDAEGNIVAVYGATLMLPGGDALTVWTGSDGLPSCAVASDGSSIEFVTYHNDKVDLVVRSPEGQSWPYNDVSVDAALLQELRSLALETPVDAASDARSGKLAHTAQTSSREWSLEGQARFGILAVKAAACGGGIYLTLQTAGLAGLVIGALTLAACESAVLSAAELLAGNDAIGEIVTISQCARADVPGCILGGVDYVLTEATLASARRADLLATERLPEGTAHSTILGGAWHRYRFDKEAGDTWIISVTTLSQDMVLDTRVMRLLAGDQTEDLVIPIVRGGETTNVALEPPLSGTLFLLIENSPGSELNYQVTTTRIRAQGASLLHGRYRLTEIDGQSIDQMFPSGAGLSDWVFADGQLVSLVGSFSDTQGERQLWQHLAPTAQTRCTMHQQTGLCQVVSTAHGSRTSFGESREVSLSYVVENLYRGGCSGLDSVQQAVEFSGRLDGSNRLTGQCRNRTTFRMLSGEEQSIGDLTATFVFVKP